MTGKTAGIAHIVASAQDGSKVTGEAQITVTAPTLGTLTVGVTPGADGYSVTVTPTLKKVTLDISCDRSERRSDDHV